MFEFCDSCTLNLSSSDETEQLWVWQYETDEDKHDLFMDVGEEIRWDSIPDSFLESPGFIHLHHDEIPGYFQDISGHISIFPGHFIVYVLFPIAFFHIMKYLVVSPQILCFTEETKPAGRDHLPLLNDM